MGSDKTLEAEIPEEVSEPVRAVVELFRGDLDEVCFPDVDRARIDARVAEVGDRVQDVATARRALEGAQQALDEELGKLTQIAERGLAYARIYAGGDEDLGERLNSISLSPRSERRRKKRAPDKPKRGKAKRNDDLELPLPADGASQEAVH